MDTQALREGEQQSPAREGAGAAALGLLAVVLLVTGYVLLAVPAAAGALWLGVRAVRSDDGARGVGALVAGGVVLLLGIGVIAGSWVLGRLAEQGMAELVAESRDVMEPEILQAAESVYPCADRIESARLRELWMQHPSLDGRPALSMREATAAQAEVRVDGSAHTVWVQRYGDGSGSEEWEVDAGRDELARACETGR